ncbi:MAG TPA: transglutaminase domain-containing protein [Chryseolinea sp.]|nr:transglutaminase domain-containing protein [Chryseolinea sp.]HPH46496.1 transglutaminase domain-containing protein [Chryseolinea sp.]HPM31241.1 transglutaminase domain-containing protein [Chryseolinea sp.]
MKLYLLTLVIIVFASGIHAQNVSSEQNDFRKADSVAALYPDHSLQNLKTLADKLTLPLSTEVEKFRAIYFWISHNIENDYEYYVKNKKTREKLNDNPEALKEWNRKFSVQVFNKLLKEHKTVCTGYAYLMKELAHHAGLSAVIVDGYGRTAQSNIGGPGYANHSWNAIQINGQWFLCDATWSSGAINMQEGSFVKQFDDAYFMANPSLFVLNHYPLDSSWMLLKDKPTLDQFLNGPLIYSNIHRYHVYPQWPKAFNVSTPKDKMFLFRMSKDNYRTFEKTTLQVNGSTISPRTYLDDGGSECIEYVFHNKGKYVVHVLLDERYVVSYNVTVH